MYDAEEEYVFMCGFSWSFLTGRAIAYLYAIRLVYYGCFHWEEEGMDGAVALYDRCLMESLLKWSWRSKSSSQWRQWGNKCILSAIKDNSDEMASCMQRKCVRLSCSYFCHSFSCHADKMRGTSLLWLPVVKTFKSSIHWNPHEIPRKNGNDKIHRLTVIETCKFTSQNETNVIESFNQRIWLPSWTSSLFTTTQFGGDNELYWDFHVGILPAW